MKQLLSLELSTRKSEIFFASKEECLRIEREHSIVSDRNVAALLPFHLPLIRTLPNGEECKTFDICLAIIDSLLQKGIDRHHTLLGIGGGAVTDVTGFVASILFRGIPLILIPTTLLGMVDAAIGGKSGVNYAGYKNMIGSFYPAQEIRICSDFLSSLPMAEYKSGLAEVIKAAMIGDSELLRIMEEQSELVLQRDKDLLQEEILPRAIHVKVRIVQQDERDLGLRQVLNLGHSFAHGLESLTGLSTLRHGEAVAWGIRIAVQYAHAINFVDAAFVERINNLLDMYGYLQRYPLVADELIQAMHWDKKRKNNQIVLILPKGEEEIGMEAMDETLLRELLPAFIGNN